MPVRLRTLAELLMSSTRSTRAEQSKDGEKESEK